MGECHKNMEASILTNLLASRELLVGRRQWSIKTMYEPGKTEQVATGMKTNRLCLA